MHLQQLSVMQQLADARKKQETSVNHSTENHLAGISKMVLYLYKCLKSQTYCLPCNILYREGNIMLGMNMTIWLSIIMAIVTLIALIWTLYIFKQEENKMKKYEADGDTVENERNRSLEYESRSLKKNVPLQIWIYTITIVVSLVVFAIYIY